MDQATRSKAVKRLQRFQSKFDLYQLKCGSLALIYIQTLNSNNSKSSKFQTSRLGNYYESISKNSTTNCCVINTLCTSFTRMCMQEKGLCDRCWSPYSLYCIYMYVTPKKFEWHFSGQLTFLNTHGRLFIKFID